VRGDEAWADGAEVEERDDASLADVGEAAELVEEGAGGWAVSVAEVVEVMLDEDWCSEAVSVFVTRDVGFDELLGLERPEHAVSPQNETIL
jgi:hypothetical protein